MPSAVLAVDSPTAEQLWRVVLLITWVVIGVFFLTTIRTGQLWGDDFAQYLLHAENIAHLRPYSETGYIYNPQNAIVGPKAYPPGYPAVLAPVIATFGRNLDVCKVLNVGLFLIALLICVRLFARDLNPANRWIALTIIGFCPIFWEFKDGIVSEHLFVPLWYATILVADDWYRGQKVYGTPILHGALLGTLIFATCATRSVGIVLVPTVIACEALMARRATRVGITAVLTAIVLLMLQRLVLPTSGAGYLEQLQGISLTSLAANAYADLVSFSLIWQNRQWDILRKVIGLSFVAVSAWGFLRVNIPKLTPLGVAFAAYFALIVIWPSAAGVRMILPLLPAFVLYLLMGLNSLSFRPVVRLIAVPTMFLVTVLTFGAAYAATAFEPFTEGAESRPASELFEYLRQETQPEDVCLFFKPRALALFTGRRASAYPLGTEEHTFSQYAASISATVLIVRNGAADLADEDQTSEMRFPFDEAAVEQVFQNSMFRVYRWKHSPADGDKT